MDPMGIDEASVAFRFRMERGYVDLTVNRLTRIVADELKVGVVYQVPDIFFPTGKYVIKRTEIRVDEAPPPVI